MNAALVLGAALFVGALALLAQHARRSRGAEITLVVVLLAFSVLVGAVGAFVGLGLLLAATGGGLPSGTTTGQEIAFLAGGATAVAVGIVGVALCVAPLRKITGRTPKNPFWSDPPVYLALWLFALVLANNAVSFLIFAVEDDVASLFPTERLSPAAVLTTQLPFVLVALAGVGAGLRRSFRQTLARLGYGGIGARGLGIVALFIAAAFGLSLVADSLFAALQPDLYREVGDLSRSLFDPSGLSPVSAVLFALLIGVGAGVGEETLFRGALQPVLGILPTSVLFASMHVQYGPSLVLGYVFLLSVGLGLLRKHLNTTACVLAHAGYNALGVLVPYFV